MGLDTILQKTRPAVIGVIHVPALPGTPRASMEIAAILDHVGAEAGLYRDAGVDAVMVENMHDVPYTKRRVGPEIVAAMTQAAALVRRESGLPTGVQILAGANEEALAAAFVAGCEFIRAEGFVFGHLADEGYIDACAGELLRYRQRIGAGRVAVVADIKKKHSSHAVTADVSLAETARAAEFFLADGLIVTGPATGVETDAAHLAEARSATTLPLFVGSGVTTQNLERYWRQCDGVIVGSHFKQDQHWWKGVDRERVQRFMDAARLLGDRQP
jgi:membrane complex biogenesis BtpA family protein